MIDPYSAQDRGSRSDYEAYFAGMDKSMQQKVALTTAHFPARGRIADMGSGSGRGTYDLACLYSGLELIGVDINPKSVQISSENFNRPNLRFITGDISRKVFSAGYLDGILNSSVLHHVTSFNDFEVQLVLSTLDNQCEQLKDGGVLIIRDFVVPDGPETVRLVLSNTDGSDSGTPAELSTAKLFEHFAKEWRSSQNRHSPVPYREIASLSDEVAIYEVSLRIAAEFVLRKDYREDWNVEVLEEYTYLSQSGFEQALRDRGLRIVTSMPLWNPWIVENRFQGKFRLLDQENQELPFPPTNYLIVGDKVEPGSGVEILESGSRRLQAPSFLKYAAYQHTQTHQVYELVERPNSTIDLLPWFEDSGQIFVLAKKDFPRPIVNAARAGQTLDRSRLSGYITEPLSAIVADPADKTAVHRILSERAALNPSDILGIEGPNVYYPSPGGINERVSAYRVQVRPPRETSVKLANYTRFHDAGTVRELDAVQTLRASQVGGMFDARLEINIYLLLRALHRSPGPWIGAQPELALQNVQMKSGSSALEPPRHQCYEPVPGHIPEFLQINEGRFQELDAAGNALAEVDFEYVLPGRFSQYTVSAIPVVRNASGFFIGVEHRDLPAVQAYTGSSAIVTAPAWRLTKEIGHRLGLPAFLEQRFQTDFGIRAKRCWELGGPYFSSPGITPEQVFPFLVEVDGASDADTPLHFVEARELLARIEELSDAHLLLSAFRLLHALQGYGPQALA